MFGAGIVAAGLALVLVALAPHLFLAIAAVMLVGGFAGIAFLTGLTIIGTEVADEIRGRVNAFVQTIVRLTLLGSLSIVPLIVGLVATRTIGPVTIDGTRLVMFAGGLVAAAVGSIAYRQMDDRRTAPMLPDLLAALRRGEPRGGTGLLVAVEGIGAEEAADQAARLAQRLRAEGHTVVALEGGAADRERWTAALREASLSGSRARALAAAAILADQVERVVRPALAAGALVVADRFLAVPLAQFGVATDGVGPDELEDLAVWATGRLRPDVSVLLDRAPADGAPSASGLAGEEHVRVRRLLTHMAAAEPHRYVVVDADGPAHEVAERIAVGLAPLLPPAPGAVATVPTPPPAAVRRSGHRRHRRPRTRVHRLRPDLLRTGPPPGAPPGIGGRHGSPPPSGADPRHALVRRHRPDRRSPTSAARSRTARPAATEPPEGGAVSVWDEVVGQPAAVAELRRAAEDPAAMTHAWLFTGPPGSGRSVAARAFAAALQCPDHGCGECAACHTVMAGTHADVREIVPEGLSISVKSMRTLVHSAVRRPSTGRYQVLIVTDADRLTEQATNALLKFIEEPPGQTIFLLCAPSDHPEDVAVTIRSRCRPVPLRAPATEAIADVLVRRDGIDPEQAAWAASVSGGHVGRARRLARDPEARGHRDIVLGLPTRLRGIGDAFAFAGDLVRSAREEATELSESRDAAEREELAVAMGAGGVGKGVAAAARGAKAAERELEKLQRSRNTRTQRDAIDRALVDLAGFYRDALVVGASAQVPLTNPDREREIRWAATEWAPESVLRRLEAVLACRTAMDQNVKPEIAVEAMMTALQRG